MKITTRNYTNCRRVKYADDNGNLIGEIDMYGDGFANCQVAPIANIEQLLTLEDSDFILKVLRKLCLGYRNIVVIDIDKETYLSQVNSLLKKNVINTMPYISTNGSNRVLVMFKTAYL
jgi:hypothetical protein